MNNVSLVYPGQAPDRPSIRDVSLTIDAGEIVAIVGPSGCGKSSTIALLAGLISPTTGSIELNGKQISQPGPDRAVVFQDYSLFPWMTAFDNIYFALKQVGKATRENTLQLLQLVGLDGVGRKYPAELSGGMRQRVAIARAFALGSPVYLMDEPFGAVDAKNRIYLQDLLVRLWEEENRTKTIVVVTHDIDEALYLSDKIVVFTPAPGRIRQVVKVPFPRPRRRIHLLNSPEYKRLRDDILSSLQTELAEELDNVEGGEGI